MPDINQAHPPIIHDHASDPQLYVTSKANAEWLQDDDPDAIALSLGDANVVAKYYTWIMIIAFVELVALDRTLQASMLQRMAHLIQMVSSIWLSLFGTTQPYFHRWKLNLVIFDIPKPYILNVEYCKQCLV